MIRSSLAALIASALFVTTAQADVGLAKVDEELVRSPKRLVALEGALNFRDIGGYRTSDGRRVKWGEIYRSAELSGLTDADYRKIEPLGLETIYDLRSTDERLSQPTRWRASPVQQMSYAYHMDMKQFAQLLENPKRAEPGAFSKVMEAAYVRMLDEHAPQFEAIFEALLRDEAPLLYHCSAGTDRTGLTTALILTALGVPRETVVADYKLSNVYYKQPMREGRVNLPKEGPLAEMMAKMRSLPPEVLEELMGGDGEAQLNAFFAEIDRRYGGVEAYLDKKLNVDSKDVARLRELYTE